MGLYYDNRHQITLCCERGIGETPHIAFHPCDNRATVIFTQEAFWNQVLPALDIEAAVLDLEALERYDKKG